MQARQGKEEIAKHLGEISEGIRFLQEGIRRCPENERVLWEYAVVLWETEFYSPRETEEAAWQYLSIVREKCGIIEEPWNEGNTYFLLEKEFGECLVFINDSKRSRYECN